MTKAISFLCALVVSIALVSPTSAQPAREKKAKPAKKTKALKTAKNARCKKGETRSADGLCTKSVNFQEGDDIDGDTPRGYGELLTAARVIVWGGLIRLRTNFHAEILKSATPI